MCDEKRHTQMIRKVDLVKTTKDDADYLRKIL